MGEFTSTSTSTYIYHFFQCQSIWHPQICQRPLSDFEVVVGDSRVLPRRQMTWSTTDGAMFTVDGDINHVIPTKRSGQPMYAARDHVEI